MNIFEIRKDPMLKEELLDSLESMLSSHSSEFRELVSYVLDKKLDLFNREDFTGPFYDGEDNMLDLVLPCITRLYGKFFIKPPNILKDNKLELFQLSFDIDDFIDYFIDMIPRMKYSLSLLENIDRTNETLSLIVDNYVGIYFNNAYNCDNIEQEIRNIKLNKLVS
jgi:hypothetical protein